VFFIVYGTCIIHRASYLHPSFTCGVYSHNRWRIGQFNYKFVSDFATIATIATPFTKQNRFSGPKDVKQLLNLKANLTTSPVLKLPST